MAIIVRIVSADGKRTVMKTLPGLPSHIKVPPGAKVDVIEKDHTISLAQYVNEHANHADRGGGEEGSKVSIETVQDWATAEAWLDTMAQVPTEGASGNAWYTTGDNQGGDGHFLGFDQEGLLVGGLVAAGAAAGVYQLTRNSGNKDTIAPLAPTGIDLASDDDTGASNSDNITSKTTGLTITGTAEPGSKVEVFDGNTSLGTVTASATGAFSKDIDLAAGDHSIATRAIDTAGNASVGSSAIKITVDTTAPAAVSALDLDAADDSGTSNSDNITSQTANLTITGTAEAGSKVELFDGTTSLGTATASTTGTFTKDISLLTPGAHAITAKATDTAGNVGAASDALTITVDGVAPTGLDLAADDDTGSSSTDNITSKTSGLTISGGAQAGYTVELFDGTTSLGTATADSNGAFTKDISLAAGVHAITAKANGGSASSALTITVDDTAPAVVTGLDLDPSDDTGLSNTDNITNDTSGVTISGTAEAGSTVQLFDGATSIGSAIAGATGSFATNVILGAGVHAITVKATDAAGNAGAASAPLNITVDVTAPGAPTGLDLAAEDDNGTSNSDNSTSLTSGLTISGTAEAGSKVEIFDGQTALASATAGANGAFTIDISLQVGFHQLGARATDAAGNVSGLSTVLEVSVAAAPLSASAEAAGDGGEHQAALANIPDSLALDLLSLHNASSLG